MIQETVRAIRDNNPIPDPPARTDKKLRADDLGYFDPDFESDYNNSIISLGRYIYYRDIFI